jgi:hypothetical protein
VVAAMPGRPASASFLRSALTWPSAARGIAQMCRLRWGGKVLSSMMLAL